MLYLIAMTPSVDDTYNSLPTCVLIAVTPLFAALLIVYFADPRGKILLEVRPLGWLVDYVVIWPLVWVSSEILQTGSWVWYSPERGINFRPALRLAGGFLLIYVCIWLCVVPLIHRLSVRYPILPIAPVSYSQLFRFLFGIAGSVSLLVVRQVVRRGRSSPP